MSEGGRYDPNAPGGQQSGNQAPGSGSAWSGDPAGTGDPPRSGDPAWPGTTSGTGQQGQSAAPGELAGLVNQPVGTDPGRQGSAWTGADGTSYPAAAPPPDAGEAPPGSPPPGWTPPDAQPAAPVASRRSQVMQWVVGGAIIAIIAIAFFIFRDRLSGNAGDLRVGDCFDDPGTTTEVSDVQHRPCNEAHDREVIFVGDYPDQDAYPAADAFDAYAAQNCTTAYEAYIGRDYETDTEFDFGYFYPLSEGWSDGDHEISCYIYRLDAQKMTQSVKAG